MIYFNFRVESTPFIYSIPTPLEYLYCVQLFLNLWQCPGFTVGHIMKYQDLVNNVVLLVVVVVGVVVATSKSSVIEDQDHP